MQSIGLTRQFGAGQASFSPDGNRYGHFFYSNNTQSYLELLDFDRCNGSFSSPVALPMTFDGGFNVGLCFSPNSNLVYVSNINNVYQYDLLSTNIQASQINVATYDSFLSVVPGFPNLPTVLCLMALTPHGKIFITTGNSTPYFHEVNNPDILGTGCNVTQHSFQIPTLYVNTLPNHPNYFLGCDTTLGCGCLTGLPHLNPPQKGGLTALPNPSNGIFTLQFNVRSIAGELEVMDVMGKVVYRDYVAPWSQFKKVNMEQLAIGIYICRIKRGNEVETVKVIKE